MWSSVLLFSFVGHVATSPCHMTDRQTDVWWQGSHFPAPGRTYVCFPLLTAKLVDARQAPVACQCMLIDRITAP